MNALFYNDDTMHNIYESKGSFDIENQLPKIVYSSLISMILNTLLNMLALSNDSVLEFKQNKDKKDVNERGENLKKKLSIKFVLYFIISFIFLFFVKKDLILQYLKTSKLKRNILILEVDILY